MSTKKLVKWLDRFVADVESTDGGPAQVARLAAQAEEVRIASEVVAKEGKASECVLCVRLMDAGFVYAREHASIDDGEPLDKHSKGLRSLVAECYVHMSSVIEIWGDKFMAKALVAGHLHLFVCRYAKDFFGPGRGTLVPVLINMAFQRTALAAPPQSDKPDVVH